MRDIIPLENLEFGAENMVFTHTHTHIRKHTQTPKHKQQKNDNKYLSKQTEWLEKTLKVIIGLPRKDSFAFFFF